VQLLAAYNEHIDVQASNTKTHYPKTLMQLNLSEAAKDFVQANPSAFMTAGDRVKEQRRLAGASKRRKTVGG